MYKYLQLSLTQTFFWTAVPYIRRRQPLAPICSIQIISHRQKAPIGFELLSQGLKGSRSQGLNSVGSAQQPHTQLLMPRWLQSNTQLLKTTQHEFWSSCVQILDGGRNKPIQQLRNSKLIILNFIIFVKLFSL